VDKLSLVIQWAFTGYLLKILMEIGKIIEPAFVAKLFQGQLVFDQQFTGMAHPDLQ